MANAMATALTVATTTTTTTTTTRRHEYPAARQGR